MKEDAREAHQNSLVDRRAMLEQRLTYVEGTLQNSVEKHGHADAIHAKLTSALEALQNQSASDSSLPDAHPDTVQPRLDALEKKLNVELTMEFSAREADVYELRELINGEAWARDADCISVQESIASERDAREAHQNSMLEGHAALEQRLDVAVQALHDSVDKHSSALEAGHASLKDQLMSLQGQLNSDKSLLDSQLGTYLERLDTLEAKVVLYRRVASWSAARSGSV